MQVRGTRRRRRRRMWRRRKRWTQGEGRSQSTEALNFGKSVNLRRFRLLVPLRQGGEEGKYKII